MRLFDQKLASLTILSVTCDSMCHRYDAMVFHVVIAVSAVVTILFAVDPLVDVLNFDLYATEHSKWQVSLKIRAVGLVKPYHRKE